MLLIFVKLVNNRIKTHKPILDYSAHAEKLSHASYLSYYWVKGEQFEDRIHRMAAQSDTQQFGNSIHRITENWQHRVAHYNLTIEFPEWQSMTAQNHALQGEERIHRMTENNLRVEFTARQRKRSHIDDAGKTLLRDNGATCKLGLRTRLHHGRKQPKLQCSSSPWRLNLCK